jgi:hypothetical protein
MGVRDWCATVVMTVMAKISRYDSWFVDQRPGRS